MAVKTPEEVVAAVFKRWKEEETPAWNLGMYMPNEDQFEKMALEAINEYCDQDMVKIAQWNADHDGVHVVQIDTPIGGGRIRVNLNDAPIWDGDPEEDSRPGAHFHDVWEEPDPVEEEARRRAALEILHKHALPADAPGAWVRAAIDNELGGKTDG